MVIIPGTIASVALDLLPAMDVLVVVRLSLRFPALPVRDVDIAHHSTLSSIYY